MSSLTEPPAAHQATRVKRERGLKTEQSLLIAAGNVFSRLTYSEARLKDVAEEAGISQGALYFHFGNKHDVARAVLSAQQDRMRFVLDEVLAMPSKTGIERILLLMESLANLMASDELVQAGILLSTQPGTDLGIHSKRPYEEWTTVTAKILKQGIADGSILPALDVQATANVLNNIFVGAQTLAGIKDKWISLPARIEAASDVIILILTTPTPGSN